MKRSNRRKDSTFLDYKDGHIVAVEHSDENNSTEKKEPEVINVKGKTIKTKIISRICSIAIGLVLCNVFVNYIYSSITTSMKIFNFLSSSHSTASQYNTVYLNEKKETQLENAQNGHSFINPLDFSGKKEYETAKKEALLLTEQITVVDQSLLGYYETLKSHVVDYLNGPVGYLSTSSRLKNLKRTIQKDYDTFSTLEFGNKEIYDVLNSRYNLLLTFLDETIKDFSRETIVNNTNSLIESDNELNALEYTILKKYLDANGLLYIEENGKITIV